MGFCKFHVKRTARFFGEERIEVFDKKGDCIEVLWKPESQEFRNPADRERVEIHSEKVNRFRHLASYAF